MSGLSLKDQSPSLKISELLLKSIAIAKRLRAKLDRAKILEIEFISIQARGGLISRGLITRRFFCLQVDGLITAWLPMKIKAHCTNFKFWITVIIKENILSQITYDAMKRNKKKAFWSKTVRSSLDKIGLGQLWIKARYMDLEIVDTIRQRFKDIELLNWMSEMN